MDSFNIKNETIDWLLTGDSSIRWQVMQDFLDYDEKKVNQEREKVSETGWGKILLENQDEDGKWAKSLYDHKWISTTYTLYLLKELGILPNGQTQKGCFQLFENGIYNNEEIRFSRKQLLRDNAVTGFVLGILSYFKYKDERLHNIAEFLSKNQNDNGTWHYDNKEGADKYEFETTLLILKGFFSYQKYFPNPLNLNQFIEKSHNFLLNHNLYLDKSENKPIKKEWLLFSYPNYWHYDILTALDYFREINLKSESLINAIEFIQKKQNKDGTWNLQNKHKGLTYFEMEEVGKPSRWNTLRALRILKWWFS
ncbi:MAG TPA: hypothetical protein PK762_13640 [Candidatus Kapabacteria bacterium]|nr:hypothetical protein [Candidatus Kapabacteria bacterium]